MWGVLRGGGVKRRKRKECEVRDWVERSEHGEEEKKKRGKDLIGRILMLIGFSLGAHKDNAVIMASIKGSSLGLESSPRSLTDTTRGSRCVREGLNL